MTAIRFDTSTRISSWWGRILACSLAWLHEAQCHGPCFWAACCCMLCLQLLSKQPAAGPHLCHPCVQAIAAKCPLSFTGADMYALCADAWMAGLKRVIAEGPDVSLAACLPARSGSMEAVLLRHPCTSLNAPIAPACLVCRLPSVSGAAGQHQHQAL